MHFCYVNQLETTYFSLWSYFTLVLKKEKENKTENARQLTSCIKE